MRIAFVVGCLEEGRDGVGDYTRLLAQECVRHNHPCCQIALNDPFVSEHSWSSESDLPVLRLSAKADWKERINQAKRFLDRFSPDWVSLQFVPYAYHPKGLALSLGRQLQQLARARRLHVMFHELWLGVSVGDSVKERLIGTVQRLCMLAMLKELRPNLVHTTNPAYTAVLSRDVARVGCLPLFGNIPISLPEDDNWLFEELQRVGPGMDWSRERTWLFGLFGALHPVWPPEPLFTYMSEAATRYQRTIAILSIGRLGPGEELWNRLAKAYGSRFTFLQLGEQPPERISQFLSTVDFGIATSPYVLIGKSGTVTSMLEHGLPVIVNRDDVRISHLEPHFSHETLLHKMDIHLPKKLGKDLNRAQACPRLPFIATQFLGELSST